MSKLRQKVRAFLRSPYLLGAELSPRLVAFYKSACEEASVPVPDLYSRLPRIAIFPSSLVRRVRELPATKRYDYAFIGAACSPDVERNRQWVFEFAEKEMTRHSLLQITDAGSGYKWKGPFDVTGTGGGADGLRPKVLPVSERDVFDEGYFRVLRQSQFTLCPAGDAPWSMRFFEAILAGSIPIVQRRLHTGRNFRERSIGYKYFRHGDNYIFRWEWVEENFDRFARWQMIDDTG